MTAFFSRRGGIYVDLGTRLEPEELVHSAEQVSDRDDRRGCLNTGGYLDKYMGDGIMAFWNGSLKQAGACRPACRCALKVAERSRR